MVICRIKARLNLWFTIVYVIRITRTPGLRLETRRIPGLRPETRIVYTETSWFRSAWKGVAESLRILAIFLNPLTLILAPNRSLDNIFVARRYFSFWFCLFSGIALYPLVRLVRHTLPSGLGLIPIDPLPTQPGNWATPRSSRTIYQHR